MVVSNVMLVKMIQSRSLGNVMVITSSSRSYSNLS